MERQKILDELDEIQEKIAGYLEILNSDERLNAVLVEEFEAIKKKFGDERRTEIGMPVGDISIEDLIADEDMVVTVSHNGYLKRTALDTYRKQGRGGRGRTGMGTRDDDFIEDLFIGSDALLHPGVHQPGPALLAQGLQHPGRGRGREGPPRGEPDQPDARRDRAGIPARKGVSRERVHRDGDEERHDQEVLARRLQPAALARHHRIGLKEGDELESAKLLREPADQQILLATHKGKAIRFNHEDVRPMGRPAAGVRGIRLDEDDWVIGLLCIKPEHLVLSLAENGIGKRTQLDQYRVTNRGGKGVINMKTTKRTGPVVKVMKVKEDNDVMIITRQGKLIRIEPSTVRKTGRSASGVKLVNLEEGDVVAAAAVAPKEEIEELEEGASNGQGTLIQ